MFNFKIPIDALRWIDFFDIIIVYLLIYYVYKAVSKTKVVLQGFAFILSTMFIAAYFELNTLKSLLEKVVSPMLLSIVILFPAEIRRGLYMIGRRTFFIKRILTQNDKTIDTIIEAVQDLVHQKVGALIVIQRNDSLQGIIETGVELNANVEANLILALFQKQSPLHDGAIVISQNHITAAACYITNLSSSHDIAKHYGTRHRAGLGASETSDAITIITSEEKGTIALAYNSNIYLDINMPKLTHLLNRFLQKGKPT